MKTHITFIIAMFIAMFILFLVTGCDTLDKGYDNVVTYTPAITNSYTKLITNSIVTPSFTNEVGVIIPEKTTQVITPIVEIVITPESYSTNLVNKPMVESGLAITGSLPVPFAGFAGGLLTLIYSIYRMIRNKQALKAVILGIEEGRKLLQTTPELQAVDSKIKDALIKHQELAGVLNTVSSVINSYTGDTVPPKQ